MPLPPEHQRIVNITAERALWDAIDEGRDARGVIARMVDRGMIASPKQAHATLEKWARRGLYDYGVSLDLGWLKAGATFPRNHTTTETTAP